MIIFMHILDPYNYI